MTNVTGQVIQMTNGVKVIAPVTRDDSHTTLENSKVIIIELLNGGLHINS